MNNEQKEAMNNLAEISNQFNDAMKRIEDEQEAYWKSLSKEEQLKAFCAVSRRIYQAEIVDQGSYRHALYTVFGFGPEAYARAQMAGYLTIHNCIYDSEHERDVLLAFCKKYNIDDAEQKVQQFYV